MKCVFGWITPKKDFIDCGRFEHIECLTKEPYFKNNPKVKELLEHAQSAKEGCEALEEAGEHGEWHSYEMALDDAHDEVWKIAMREGYIRVCSDGASIHFEMKRAQLIDFKQFCIDFAEDRDMIHVFEFVD